jgi:hypothetical protein
MASIGASLPVNLWRCIQAIASDAPYRLTFLFFYKLSAVSKSMDFRTLSRDHVLTHIWGRVNHPEVSALPVPDMLHCQSEDIDFFQEQLAETLLENYSSIAVYQYIFLEALKQNLNSTAFEMRRFLSGSTEVLFESYPNSLILERKMLASLLFIIPDKEVWEGYTVPEQIQAAHCIYECMIRTCDELLTEDECQELLKALASLLLR